MLKYTRRDFSGRDALSANASTAEIFRRIPLFRAMEDKELKALANLSKVMTFGKGDLIVREGEAGLGFYLIEEGEAIVRHRDKKVATLGRGDFFGEMALLDEQPRSADVMATEPTRCLVLLRWNFWSMVSKNPNIVRGLLREMSRRLRESNKAMSE
jgi:CRP/FNR family transcriptional regulator, cyclic AMP receptor protein